MEGKSIRLRNIEPKDLNWICQWWQDAELMRYYNRLPIANRCQIEKEIQENQRSNKRQDFIILRHGDNPVGLTYLSNINWKNRNCQVHVMLADRKVRQKSYCGVEAVLLLLLYSFFELNMHRVEAQTIEYATTALRALQAIGFRIECRQSDYYFQDGKYFDRYFLGILCDEFREQLNTGKLRKYAIFFSTYGKMVSNYIPK